MQRDYRSVLTNFKSDDATTHTESSKLLSVFMFLPRHDKTCLVVVNNHQIIGLDWRCVELYTHDKTTLKVFKNFDSDSLFKPHFCITYTCSEETVCCQINPTVA